MIILYVLLLLFLFWILAIVCDAIFVPALEKIAKRRNMSAEFAGATLMAIGSSAPELFTSIFALTKGTDTVSLGAGTIVGSALFNILVIIGATALISNVKLAWKPVIRDLGMYIIAILVLLGTFRDGQVVIREALLYVSLYIIYIIIAKNWSKRLKYTDHIQETDDEPTSGIAGFFAKIIIGRIPRKNYQPYVVFVISIIIIGLATHFMVDSGIYLAQAIGMSPALIGLTILAIGTSVPDLISSIVVAKDGKGNMAVANGIGSNIFDILFGLGIPYLLYFVWYHKDSIPVANDNLQASIILLFAMVIAVLLVLLIKKWNLSRLSGLFLILLYIGYLVWQIIVR